MHGMSFILADIFMKVEPVNLQSNIHSCTYIIFIFIYYCITLRKMLNIQEV